MRKSSELKRLREQVKKQRTLLRRTQRWLGVAVGALAACQAKSTSHTKMRDSVTDVLDLAGDVSAALAELD